MSTALPGLAARGHSARETFLSLLDRSVEDAVIRVVCDDGERTVGQLGSATRHSPDSAELVVHRPRFFGRVMAHGNLGMGEAFMDGDFDVSEGRLYDLLTILIRARLDRKIRGDWRLVLRWLSIRARNRLRGAWGNVQRHMDAGDELFVRFLDPTLAYTCGYARHEDDDVATLQQQKFDRICQKLRLRPGEQLLDVGCGFGGLLIHAARHYGVSGTGIVNSRRHFELGRQRVAEAGLEDRVEIRYADHRSMSGRYDKTVSVGLLEHLSRPEYRRYFANVARVLKPGGMGLAHFIGCGGPVNEHDPWIQKYIFPGSGQPKLSEVATLLEENELAILDVENLVRHYAVTCMRWLENFRRTQGELDQDRFPERFQRMIEYYLCLCVAAARASDGALYQVLYGNDFAAEHPFQRV